MLDYYLNLLDPDSSEHKEGIAEVDRGGYFKEKVLKILFLYYFIFASRSQPSSEDYNLKEELQYAPDLSFDRYVLKVSVEVKQWLP